MTVGRRSWTRLTGDVAGVESKVDGEERGGDEHDGRNGGIGRG